MQTARDERAEFEKWARESGIALFFAYEDGRGYMDMDTWKAFAAWQGASHRIEALTQQLKHAQAQLANCNALIGKIQGTIDKAFPSSRESDLDILDRSVQKLSNVAALQQHLKPWKDAVIDACCCNHLLWDENDPRKTLTNLIRWECQAALDPKVSEDAQKLMDRGTEKVPQLADQMAEALRGLYPHCHEKDMRCESVYERAWLACEAALAAYDASHKENI